MPENSHPKTTTFKSGLLCLTCTFPAWHSDISHIILIMNYLISSTQQIKIKTPNGARFLAVDKTAAVGVLSNIFKAHLTRRAAPISLCHTHKETLNDIYHFLKKAENCKRPFLQNNAYP